MTFAGLAPGASVFLDANTLVYYFQPHPVHGPACEQLVQRIEQRQLSGFTSTQVLAETAHRLTTIEAAAVAGWSPGKVTQRLRQPPTTFQNLTRFQTAVDGVLQSSIQVLAIPPMLLGTAARLSRQFGLLINDALIVAVMQHSGLTNLASNDSDFDRVPGLTRYAPA